MKKVIIIVAAALSVLIGLFVEPVVSRENLGNIVDLSMDQNGDAYLLSFLEEESYGLNKIDSKGNIIYKLNLEKNQQTSGSKYRQLEIDKKGNIYLLFSQIQENADKTKTVVEKVLMYNSDGEFIKEILKVDTPFKQDDITLMPYIYKVEVLNEKVRIICHKNNQYEVMEINPIQENKVRSIKKFTLTPHQDIGKDTSWVSEMSVSEDGKVFYSTKRGELFVIDKEGNTKDITSSVGKRISLTNFSTDGTDIYFTDTISGSFYKINTNDLAVKKIYEKNTIINKKHNIEFKDVKYIFAISGGGYGAIQKGSPDIKYISIGENENLISSVMPQFFPSRLLMMALIIVGSFIIMILILFLYKKIKERFNLTLKIELLFVPVYIVLVSALLYIVLHNTTLDYGSMISRYQQSSVNLMLDYVDGDEFQKLDNLKEYMSPEYVKVQKSLDEGFEKTQSIIDVSDLYFIAYSFEGDKLYLSTNNEYNSPTDFSKTYIDINIRHLNEIYTPIEYMLDKDTVEKYYEMVKEIKTTGGTVTHEYKNNYGDWIGVLTAIKNSKGEVVGILENRIDRKDAQANLFWQTSLMTAGGIIILAILIAVYLFFVLRISFRPIGKLKTAVDKISKGDFNTEVNVKTRDELADVATTINIMTENVRNNIRNLTVLNKAYMKFVPQELFGLLGKKNVTDIDICDKKVRRINLLYLTFNVSYHEAFGDMSEDEHFDIMNETFKKLISVVQRNNGVIQSFDGSGMMVLFPHEADKALDASMQFRELPIRKEIKERMNIVMGEGDTLIGVFGSDTRATITTSSDEIMQINYISNQIEKIGVKHVSLESMIERIKDKNKYSYRFIGIINPMSNGKETGIYQLFDNDGLYDKNMYSLTKELFEKAVRYYIDEDLVRARKMFADILKINGEDRVAMHYLSLCDKKMGTSLDGFKGYIFD